MREYFLTTERLGFSVWNADDKQLAVSLWGEPQVTRFICASGIFTEQEIDQRLALEIENHKNYGIQYFPVFELKTAELVGCCGLRPYNGEKKIFEFGIHFRPKFWRQGFGFEAGSAVINHAFSVLHADELKAGHNPKNIASKVLLAKLGFKYEKDSFYPPTGLYHPSYSMTSKDRQL